MASTMSRWRRVGRGTRRVAAFTGEVSPKMILDVGCKYVILGESECRHKLGDSDRNLCQRS